MFEQFTNSIKATLYDRISNPLSNSFLFSWVLWNYKIIVILFSSLRPYEKISEIDIFISTTVFKVDFYEPLGYWCSNGFLFPLLSALLYLYIYPIPSKIIYEHWLGKQKELQDLKNKVDEVKLLSFEDSQRIKKSALDMEFSYVDYMSEKDSQLNKTKLDYEDLKSLHQKCSDENESLKQSLADKNKEFENFIGILNQTKASYDKLSLEFTEVQSALKTYKDKDAQLDSIEFKVLTAFINSTENRVYENELLKIYSDKLKIKAEQVIDEFIKNKFITVNITGSYNGRLLTLTELGKKHYTLIA